MTNLFVSNSEILFIFCPFGSHNQGSTAFLSIQGVCSYMVQGVAFFTPLQCPKLGSEGIGSKQSAAFLSNHVHLALQLAMKGWLCLFGNGSLPRLLDAVASYMCYNKFQASIWYLSKWTVGLPSFQHKKMWRDLEFALWQAKTGTQRYVWATICSEWNVMVYYVLYLWQLYFLLSTTSCTINKRILRSWRRLLHNAMS